MRSRLRAIARFVATVQFSRTAGNKPPARQRDPGGASAPISPGGCRSLKAQQHAGTAIALKKTRFTAMCRPGSVDVLGPLVARDARDGQLAPAGRPKALPRKEVIQPQLPLRLPCYDFTPVTSPTVDGSPPGGLGHRLRVLLTPVV